MKSLKVKLEMALFLIYPALVILIVLLTLR